jgi:hypothetical protein
LLKLSNEVGEEVSLMEEQFNGRTGERFHRLKTIAGEEKQSARFSSYPELNASVIGDNCRTNS